MFRVQVGWVLLACDLSDLQLSVPDPLLDPEASALEMPEFTEALPTADPDGRLAVCPQP